MLFKLSLRNAKRSMKDYLIYMLTMAGIVAFMFAFDSLIFTDIVQNMWETAMVMAVMIGFVTFFIVLIVAWLINYMVHFMLEKRSREFGTYLLLGMKKKTVSRLYMRENMILGAIALFFGVLAGVALKQVIMTIFYHLFSQDYHIQMGDFHWCLLMTAGCFALCFLLALRHNRKIFKKMTIADFIDMEKESEAVETGREKWKQILFPASLCYFIFFFYLMYWADYNTAGVILTSVLFIAAIYLFYHGLAAWLVCYIRRGGRLVYRSDGLFLLRQLSSKIRTMRFTMGTLTILFTVALLGGTVAMMFAGYQKEAINSAIPFDLMMTSKAPEDRFNAELDFLKKEGVKTKNLRIYEIYHDSGRQMNDYLYTHVANLGSSYTDENGKPDRKAIEAHTYNYYDYDTYMSLSDYNALRKMLGYEPVSMKNSEYLLHIKQRVLGNIADDFLHRKLSVSGEKLSFTGAYTEAFSLNGINGADYVIVVADRICRNLTPYYAVAAADLVDPPQEDLQDKLEAFYYHQRGLLTEMDAEKLETELENRKATPEEKRALEQTKNMEDQPNGSDQIMTLGRYNVAVKDNITANMLSMVSAITFPLAYIALIFVCVALTILAVQQLSDSSRYRYRYDVLRKMGVSDKGLTKIVRRQLSLYYLVPMAVSLFLSAFIGIFAGERFTFYTGAAASSLSYFTISALVFMGIYLLYFIATYLGFKRNVEEVFIRLD